MYSANLNGFESLVTFRLKVNSELSTNSSLNSEIAELGFVLGTNFLVLCRFRELFGCFWSNPLKFSGFWKSTQEFTSFGGKGSGMLLELSQGSSTLRSSSFSSFTKVWDFSAEFKEILASDGSENWILLTLRLDSPVKLQTLTTLLLDPKRMISEEKRSILFTGAVLGSLHCIAEDPAVVEAVPNSHSLSFPNFIGVEVLSWPYSEAKE